ncbi:hypothetical protein PF006_g24859 [Phytophthora fragariae]|uniref:Aquaporin n=1 Tax=Phytophthora fragariae TaxID=53985 RepID=A0A6A3RCY2_9STRA|nr:hypothetical protein PF003_g16879 [Phytophthora fragariae]KAE9091748.1 hypothetical protein PF006_g24859 [Phytophthora fragariae]
MLSPTLRTLALECASEFIGTFVLVFLGTAGIAAAAFTTPGSVDLALEQVAIGWGVAATLATIVGSPGSGAHLNPAVTLAIAISPHTRSGFQTCKIPAYMLFQLLGATIAGLAVYLVFGSAIARYEARLGLSRGTGSSSLSAVAFGASFLHPQLVYASGEEGSSFWSKSDVSVVGAVFLEALGTMLFVLVQRVIRQPQQETGVSEPGTRLRASGGSGHCRLGTVALPGERADSCWVYLVGPMVGAAVGSLLFDFAIHPGLQTRDEAAAAWMRHQQMEGEAILEQLEKSQTLLSMTAGGGFESLTTRGLHHSDFRDSPTPHNYRLSSPGHLHTYAA